MTKTTTKSYKYFKNGKLVWKGNVLGDIVLYNKERNEISRITTQQRAETLIKNHNGRYEIRSLEEESIKIVEVVTMVIENELN